MGGLLFGGFGGVFFNILNSILLVSRSKTAQSVSDIFRGSTLHSIEKVVKDKLNCRWKQ